MQPKIQMLIEARRIADNYNEVFGWSDAFEKARRTAAACRTPEYTNEKVAAFWDAVCDALCMIHETNMHNLYNVADSYRSA
jgi:hypothetical protein